MAESIKGSSSSLYIKEEVPSVTNSADTMNHLSVQNLWGARGSADVLVHGIYKDTLSPLLIESGSVKRKIKITNHNAKVGDFLKMNNGSSDGEEISIIKIIDNDFFVISKEINASIGDECFILKPVTPQYSKDGSLSVSQGPVQFNKDGSIVEVKLDTATPSNTKSLPTELIYEVDGTPTRVSYNTVTPHTSTAIPVNIVTVNGKGIETTVHLDSAQINVQLSSQGDNPDSVRIGDSTTKTAQIYDDGSNTHLRTYDSNLLAELENKANQTEKQYVSIVGDADPNNTTTTALGANATFTGTWTDVVDYSAISLGVYADQNSATDGLKYQFSHDGVSVHHEHSYSYITDTYGTGYSVPVEFRYYRVVYTNGAVAQTSLVISSTLKQTALFPSSYKVTQKITDQTQALFTRGVIVGQNTSTNPIHDKYVNVKVNNSGALTTEVNGNSNAKSTISDTHDVVVVGGIDTNSKAAMLKLDKDTGELLVQSTLRSSANNTLSSTAITSSSISTTDHIAVDTALYDKSSGLSVAISNTSADSLATDLNRLKTESSLVGFNGTTIDRIRSGISGIVAGITGYMNTVWVGKYNSTAPTLTDGQWVEPQFDVNGNVKVNIASGNITGFATSSNQTDGNQKSQVYGIAKNATPANSSTVSVVDNDHNALDVYIRGGTISGGSGFIPNPTTSPSRKTTSYTVPAGKYARAICSFYLTRHVNISSGSTTFTAAAITVNGSEILRETSFGGNMSCGTNSQTIINLSGISGKITGTAVKGAGSTFSLYTGAGSTYTFGSATVDSPIFITGHADTQLYVLNSGGVGFGGFSFTVESLIKDREVEVWLKPGDVLTGTGGNWQAIVTEYTV